MPVTPEETPATLVLTCSTEDDGAGNTTYITSAYVSSKGDVLPNTKIFVLEVKNSEDEKTDEYVRMVTPVEITTMTASREEALNSDSPYYRSNIAKYITNSIEDAVEAKDAWKLRVDTVIAEYQALVDDFTSETSDRPSSIDPNVLTVAVEEYDAALADYGEKVSEQETAQATYDTSVQDLADLNEEKSYVDEDYSILSSGLYAMDTGEGQLRAFVTGSPALIAAIVDQATYDGLTTTANAGLALLHHQQEIISGVTLNGLLHDKKDRQNALYGLIGAAETAVDDNLEALQGAIEATSEAEAVLNQKRQAVIDLVPDYFD